MIKSKDNIGGEIISLLKEDSYEDVVGFDKERELNKLHGNDDIVEKNIQYLLDNLPGNMFNNYEDAIRKTVEIVVEDGSDIDADGMISDIGLFCDDLNDFDYAYNKGELASLKINTNLYDNMEDLLYTILKGEGYTYAGNPKTVNDKEAMKIVPISMKESEDVAVSSTNFRCPKCNEELDELGCAVKALQTIDLNTGEYSSVGDVLETLEYYCPKCGSDLDYDTCDEIVDKLQDWEG